MPGCMLGCHARSSRPGNHASDATLLRARMHAGFGGHEAAAVWNRCRHPGSPSRESYGVVGITATIENAALRANMALVAPYGKCSCYGCYGGLGISPKKSYLATIALMSETSSNSFNNSSSPNRSRLARQTQHPGQPGTPISTHQGGSRNYIYANNLIRLY